MRHLFDTVKCSCGDLFSLRLNEVDGDLDLYHGDLLVSWVSSPKAMRSNAKDVSEFLLHKSKSIVENTLEDNPHIRALSCGYGWREV